MKICTHCTAQNRDEAIFCSRCKRALPATPAKTGPSARQVLFWLLAASLLIALSFFLLRSRAAFAPAAAQMPTPGLVRTHAPEPFTPSTCVENKTIRVRRGPGKQYETIGGLAYGACFVILGRNEEASWLYVVSEDHQTGWIDTSVLSVDWHFSRVSVRDHSAPPNSARPTLTTAEIAHGAQAYLTEVSATSLPQSSASRHVAPCFTMVDRIGDHISCKLERAYCDYLPALEGSPTSCTDRPYPDHTFTLLVLGEDWSDYDGQCLIVSGYLEVERGALHIQALNRSQVSSCG